MRRAAALQHQLLPARLLGWGLHARLLRLLLLWGQPRAVRRQRHGVQGAERQLLLRQHGRLLGGGCKRCLLRQLLLLWGHLL